MCRIGKVDGRWLLQQLQLAVVKIQVRGAGRGQLDSRAKRARRASDARAAWKVRGQPLPARFPGLGSRARIDRTQQFSWHLMDYRRRSPVEPGFQGIRALKMGIAYAAFVIDVFARKIVGCRVSTLMTASFVLDAPDQAIRQCRPALGSSTHRSNRCMHCLSIRYAERMAEAGIDMSV